MLQVNGLHLHYIALFCLIDTQSAHLHTDGRTAMPLTWLTEGNLGFSILPRTLRHKIGGAGNQQPRIHLFAEDDKHTGHNVSVGIGRRLLYLLRHSCPVSVHTHSRAGCLQGLYFHPSLTSDQSLRSDGKCDVLSIRKCINTLNCRVMSSLADILLKVASPKSLILSHQIRKYFSPLTFNI